MHELQITQALVEIVAEKIKDMPDAEVARINIVLGRGTDFLPEPIQYYFPFCSRDTGMEHAELCFSWKDMVFQCKSCGKKFEAAEMVFTCPACAQNRLEMVSGNECIVESIEVKNEKD